MEVINGELVMSKDERRAVDALHRVENGPAWSRCAAYVVLSPFNGKWGKIKVAYPADGAGPLHVFAWDCEGSGLYYGKASGYGYDKLSAALCGMKWDSLTFTDHPTNWEMQLRKAGYTVIQAI